MSRDERAARLLLRHHGLLREIVVIAGTALVAALMSDKAVAACASESRQTQQVYVAHAFELRHVTLGDGTRMTAAVAVDPCLAEGQSTRILIYERRNGGYRRVLDGVTLPAFAQVNADGTVVLPTHDSVEVILESTFVWSGTRYVFSAARSHRYDVALGERRPYQITVRFAPGTTSVTLSGSVAYNFGDKYVFEARAGQQISIELSSETGPRAPSVSLYFDDRASSLVEFHGPSASVRTLPKGGTYSLFVFGTDERDEHRSSRYVLRLAIR